MNSSLVTEALCVSQEREGWGPGQGEQWWEGDLAAWISSKKGCPDAQPGVARAESGTREVGTGVDKEQRLAERGRSLSFYLLAGSLIH